MGFLTFSSHRLKLSIHCCDVNDAHTSFQRIFVSNVVRPTQDETTMATHQRLKDAGETLGRHPHAHYTSNNTNYYYSAESSNNWNNFDHFISLLIEKRSSDVGWSSHESGHRRISPSDPIRDDFFFFRGGEVGREIEHKQQQKTRIKQNEREKKNKEKNAAIVIQLDGSLP